TLQGNGANSTLNLNGTGASDLQTGSLIKDFGTVNKNDGGSWALHATLDGDPGALTNVNVNDGTLFVDKANFLGSSATTVTISDASLLDFDGAQAGTFAGNIVEAEGSTDGQVAITGPNTTTLSGNN